MNPEQTNNQQSSPEAPQQTAPQPVGGSVGSMPSMPKSGGSSSTMKVVIIAIFAVLLLVAAGVGAFFLMGSDNGPKNAANKFVETTVDGDHEDALELTDSDRDEEDAVLGLIKSLDEQIGSDSYEIDTVKTKGDKRSVFYIVDEDEDKTFRIDLEEKKGEWLVVGITFSIGDSKSSDSEESDDDNEQPSQSSGETKNVTACLPAAALEGFWRYKHGWQFYFKPDSNQLQDYGNGQLAANSLGAQSIGQIAEFYKNNTEYQFTFVIDVGLYQSTDQTLAQKRAGVIAYNMNLQGIPYERMRLGKITSGGTPDRPDLAAGSRNATVNINSKCDALNESQNLDVDGAKSRGQVGA